MNVNEKKFIGHAQEQGENAKTDNLLIFSRVTDNIYQVYRGHKLIGLVWRGSDKKWKPNNNPRLSDDDRQRIIGFAQRMNNLDR